MLILRDQRTTHAAFSALGAVMAQVGALYPEHVFAAWIELLKESRKMFLDSAVKVIT